MRRLPCENRAELLHLVSLVPANEAERCQTREQHHPQYSLCGIVHFLDSLNSLMGDHFTRADWDHVQERAAAITTALQAKGLIVEPCIPLPPVPQRQVDALRGRMAFTLPQDFVDLVTPFACGWTFGWDLPDDQGEMAGAWWGWLQEPDAAGGGC